MSISKKQWCLQEDIQEWIDRWGNETWLQLYEPGKFVQGDGSEGTLIWSFLINKSSVIEELKEYTFQQFDGYPCTDNFEKYGTHFFYSRFGYEDREPILFKRSFPTKNSYIEISQEFVLFFQLFNDSHRNQYILEHDDGKEEVVLKITNTDEVLVKTHRMKQFLAFKDMALMIGISNMRHFNEPIGKKYKPRNTSPIIKLKNDEIHYALWYQPGVSDTNFFTEIIGKKIIYGMPIESTGIYPFEEKRQYESFLIGVDDRGKVVEHSCNPETLANYFGANPDSPHYLTPVYFSKEVLSKYYSDTTKYKVGDGSIVIGRYTLRADTNHTDYVIVFLGDLGRDITNSEQKYWKSFNILPGGGMSSTAFRRAFLGEFADPEAEHFIFMVKYEQVQTKFVEQNGWDFLKPLTKDDEYRLSALRIPVAENQQEFDQMIEHLQIILIESINDKYFDKLLTKADLSKESKGKKSIKKIEILSAYRRYVNFEKHIEFLVGLNLLRNKGASHRKGSKEYLEIRELFQLDDEGYISTFRGILKQAIEFLEFILDIADDDFLKLK